MKKKDIMPRAGTQTNPEDSTLSEGSQKKTNALPHHYTWSLKHNPREPIYDEMDAELKSFGVLLQSDIRIVLLLRHTIY